MGIIKSNYSVDEGRTEQLWWLAVPHQKELLYYATSAGRETLKNDYSMERRDINLYMLTYILRGGCRLVVEGRETELRQGDLCFLHLVKHSVLSTTEDMTQIIYFHITGAQTESIYNAYTENGDFVLHNVPTETVTDTYEKFAATINTDGGFYEQSRVLYGLLIEILRLRSVEPQNKHPKIIDRMLSDIMYSCPPPTPAQLASRFGFNQIYLERKFKRYVGMSMRDYILKQKFDFACRFLVDTDMSVDEIARKVGYADSKGLIALFAKLGKLTPLAYRKNAHLYDKK